MADKLRRSTITLLALSLCLAALTNTTRGQTAEETPQASENIDMSVMIRQEGDDFFFITENLDISFVNATSPPLNTSMTALTDHFQSLRFSSTWGSIFLRVSYDATLDAHWAEAYADDVLGDFRKAFNLTLASVNKTHFINNETSSIDVYYDLSRTVWNIASLGELAKYHPADGFGQLVTRDLLVSYLRNDFIPGTILNQRGIRLKYDLTRTGLGHVWKFLLTTCYQVAYKNEDRLAVSLNELLNHSGPITPSAWRYSQVTMSFLKRQLTRKTPFLLTLNSSSPPYTGLTEEKAQITDLNEETTLTNLIYNLTGPVDDVSILFNVATENNPNSIPTIIIAFSAVCIVFIDVFVFVRTRRRKLVQPESIENSK